MKNFKLLSILIGIIAFSCSSPDKPKTQFMAEKIKINELRNSLLKLQNGKTEFNFIGITSNGIDCIYFMPEKGKFNIDFEVMVEEQKPYLEKLKQFANSNNYKFILTTYNNKPKYLSSGPATVIKIIVDANLDEINRIGIKIENEVFNNNFETIYEVVP